MTTIESVRRLASLAVFAAAALSACGGGDAPQAQPAAVRAHPMNGVGSGGTGKVKTYAVGPIAGYGSIVVNGVHYDDTAAAIVDDDGNALTAAQLRLGGEVSVDAGPITAGTAVASRIQVSTDLVGLVDQAWNAATGELVVMGQPVAVAAGTALDAYPGGVSAIAAGSLVEVSSTYDPASGVYAATRIDPHASATAFKARGAIAALDTKAKTWRIGTQVFSYALAANPPKLKNGQLVCAETRTARNAAGQWIVSTFVAAPAAPDDGVHAEIDGDVAGFVDASHFSVDGVPVDASAAAVSPPGAVVADGVQVSVKGAMSGGVLVASQLQVGDGGDDGHGNGNDNGQGGGKGKGKGKPASMAPRTITIDGPLLSTPDRAAQTFVVRGPTTVDYAAATWVDGTAADLAAGRAVRLTGRLSADGTRVIAGELSVVR